ncbi:MAG: M14 family zinc carboxypeptidase [Christensenellales bacterium]
MTFEELNAVVMGLSELPNVDSFLLGQSTLGQDIYGYHLGSYDGNQILIEGGIHAREYPASLVVCGMVEYLSTQELNGGIYVLPLVNPDGARLVLDGVDWVECEKLREYILSVNNGSLDFSQWKADILAVDLNVNFDALWGGGSQNVFCPSPGNFVGYYPDSEREVREMIDFTYRVSPSLTLSYHTKGEVIYYGFETLTPEQIERDRLIALEISAVNGYTPIKTERSTGGYSDWVSEYLGVPAFTIEIAPATEPTPVPLEQVPIAVEKNKDVPIVLLNLLSSNEEINQ